jgi:anti-anti-sigma factor
MPSKQVVSIEPQPEVIHAVVNRTDLNDAALDQMQAEVAAAATQHPNLPVVLDLTGVNYVPSMGLGTLVMLMRHLKSSNQRFILVGLQAEVRTVLAITRLDKLFEIHTNLDAALSNIRGTTATHHH